MAIKSSFGNRFGSVFGSRFFNASESGSVIVETDSFFNNVSYLLRFEDGAGNIPTDDGPNNLSCSLSGTTAIVSNQFKYGSGSLYTPDSTITNSCEVNLHSSMNLGSGNFTLECFYRANAFSGAYKLVDCFRSISGENSGYEWFVNSSSLSFWFANTSNVRQFITTPSNFFVSGDIGQWRHVAVVRNGNSFLFFKEGQLISTISNSSTIKNIQRTTASINKGGNGYMDNTRLTNGVARYTSNFTVPEKDFPTS